MLPDPNAIGGRLYASGWKTGSVLSDDHCKKIAPLQRGGQAPYDLQPDECLIVVSQTCDVVATKLSHEPYVEVLLARSRQKIDSTRAGLRSTRYLSFRAWVDGPILEAHGTNRFWLPREVLDGWAPDPKRVLSPRAISLITEWLALRYTRPAWPTSFVERLRPQQKAFESILGGVALEMAEIRLAITDIDQELPNGHPYRVTVFGIADADLYYGDQAGREACIRAFQDLLDAIRKCPDIVVEDDSEFLAGDKFDWQTNRMTHQWNFANLTDAGKVD